MARRRSLGKKRKSYSKTRNKKNKKNKKTVRKTRRMRGGIFGLSKEEKAAAATAKAEAAAKEAEAAKEAAAAREAAAKETLRKEQEEAAKKHRDRAARQAKTEIDEAASDQVLASKGDADAAKRIESRAAKAAAEIKSQNTALENLAKTGKQIIPSSKTNSAEINAKKYSDSVQSKGVTAGVMSDRQI